MTENESSFSVAIGVRRKVTDAAVAKNCTRMSSFKTVTLLHLSILVIILTTSLTMAKSLDMKSNKRTMKYFKTYQKDIIQLESRQSNRRPRHLGPMNSTPSGRMRGYFFCRTGFLLEIDKNGRIAGTANISSENAVIEVEVFGEGLRRMKGVASGRYLSLNNRRGRLTSTVHQDRNTFFKEKLEENYWSSYSSKQHGLQCGRNTPSQQKRKEWFIAIKENGSLRRPCRTLPGMSATHFIFVWQRTVNKLLIDK